MHTEARSEQAGVRLDRRNLPPSGPGPAARASSFHICAKVEAGADSRRASCRVLPKPPPMLSLCERGSISPGGSKPQRRTSRRAHAKKSTEHAGNSDRIALTVRQFAPARGDLPHLVSLTFLLNIAYEQVVARTSCGLRGEKTWRRLFHYHPRVCYFVVGARPFRDLQVAGSIEPSGRAHPIILDRLRRDT